MTGAGRKAIAIVQARMGSTRLPGKVMSDINGKPAIYYGLTRAARAGSLDSVWMACSENASDDPLAAYGESLGFPVFRGDEEDVLGRFVSIARSTDADLVIRLTGDCPFVEPEIIERVVARLAQGDVDFASNTLKRSYPDGLDVEAFTRAALERADTEATLPFLRLHVTPYIHGRLRDTLPFGGFTNAQVVHDTDFSHLRWTLDEPEDLEFFRRLVPLLPENFHWLDVVAAMTRHPELFRYSRKHAVYEGTERDLRRLGHKEKSGRRFDRANQFMSRAQQVVPLASQTFSKSYQQYVNGAAPNFIESGNGCRVTDLDGNEYIDYVLGLLPIILGYRDPDVDAAIIEQLDRGITFSLATRLETELSEELVRLLPSAEMVRFGKNGSDATTAAIRLARAHTGRDRVAICGYHGWHDWYIGTTTRKLGVPKAVQDLSSTFPFNDADALEKLLEAAPDKYAAVILEPDGVVAPAPGFLERVRDVTERHGVVLIFDEIVTGFRIGLGGAQTEYGVTPDLTAVGKSMGNGMPISAVVGRRDLMIRMEDIFFSGTFGGEALSLAAALATIAKLERESVPDRLKQRGAELKQGANRAIEINGMSGFLNFRGADWWPRIAMASPPVDNILMASLLRQEFIAEGLLMASSFNLCLAHDSDRIVTETLDAFSRSLASVADALNQPDPASCLRGDPIQLTFSVR